MTRETAPVTALLAAAVAAVYAVERLAGGQAICAAWGFSPSRPGAGTALSSLFLHDPNGVSHVGGNLVFLVIFGSIVERALGSLRFAGLYLAAGLGGCAVHALTSTGTLVGCSGALFGLLAVAAVLRPRLLGFTIAFAGVAIWEAFTGGSGAASFGCHLGGFVVGFLVVLFMRVTGSEILEAA